MHNHFITKCKICGIIISQCRCMSKNKIEILDICDECKTKYSKHLKKEK